MNEGWKRFHGTDEEVMWRIQVLKRTSRLCAAKAKELERMAEGGRRHARHGPRVAHGRAEAHRQRDGVAVRELPGEVVLDADTSPRASTARPCAPCGSAS